MMCSKVKISKARDVEVNDSRSELGVVVQASTPSVPCHNKVGHTHS